MTPYSDVALKHWTPIINRNPYNISLRCQPSLMIFNKKNNRKENLTFTSIFDSSFTLYQFRNFFSWHRNHTPVRQPFFRCDIYNTKHHSAITTYASKNDFQTKKITTVYSVRAFIDVANNKECITKLLPNTGKINIQRQKQPALVGCCSFGKLVDGLEMSEGSARWMLVRSLDLLEGSYSYPRWKSCL